MAGAVVPGSDSRCEDADAGLGPEMSGAPDAIMAERRMLSGARGAGGTLVASRGSERAEAECVEVSICSSEADLVGCLLVVCRSGGT
jgi:hypothetical protein